MKGKGGSSPPLRPPGILGSTFSVPRFHYLLVPVEPVGGGPGEGTQVSQEPPPPQVELDGLQQPQGQAEHEGQVQGPRPARLEPGGLHRCAPRGSRAISGPPPPPGRGDGLSQRCAWRMAQPRAPLCRRTSSLLPRGGGGALGGTASAWPEEAGANFLTLSNPLSIEENLHSGRLLNALLECHTSAVTVFNHGRSELRF